MSKPYFVYMLRCCDKSLYTGITNDLHARIEMHAKGKGAKYVRSRLPFKLVYSERVGPRGKALSREAALKALTKIEKETLLKAKPSKPKKPPRS